MATNVMFEAIGVSWNSRMEHIPAYGDVVEYSGKTYGVTDAYWFRHDNGEMWWFVKLGRI